MYLHWEGISENPNIQEYLGRNASIGMAAETLKKLKVWSCLLSDIFVLLPFFREKKKIKSRSSWEMKLRVRKRQKIFWWCLWTSGDEKSQKQSQKGSKASDGSIKSDCRIQPYRTPGKLNTATSFSTSILCSRSWGLIWGRQQTNKQGFKHYF